MVVHVWATADPVRSAATTEAARARGVREGLREATELIMDRSEKIGNEEAMGGSSCFR